VASLVLGFPVPLTIGGHPPALALGGRAHARLKGRARPTRGPLQGLMTLLSQGPTSRIAPSFFPPKPSFAREPRRIDGGAMPRSLGAA